MVFNSYAYSTLPEFNAILRQFNVLADRGKEESRTYRHQGLVYRILDEKGERVGVPIKASSLACKPTLQNLEKRFVLNEGKKQACKEALKTKIDTCLTASSSLKELTEGLGKNGVFALLRKNADDRVYGITFVDNQSRCVFNGSDLGRLYSVMAVQSRLATNSKECKKDVSERDVKPSLPVSTTQSKKEDVVLSMTPSPLGPLVKGLLTAKNTYDYVPGELLKKKKHKKRNLGL
jgi:hypothetical protein